jgi:hypothetical protein
MVDVVRPGVLSTSQAWRDCAHNHLCWDERQRMRHRIRVVTCLLICSLLLLCHTTAVGAMHAGEMAPDFSLPATTGDTISLAAYRGKQPVVVFFYIAAFGGT